MSFFFEKYWFLDQILARGPNSCLGLIVHTKFVENMNHVAFCGMIAVLRILDISILAAPEPTKLRTSNSLVVNGTGKEKLVLFIIINRV
jgi:hypothetical protein